MYIYRDGLPGRRLSSDMIDSKTALEAAKSFARAERDKERNDEIKRDQLPKPLLTPNRERLRG